jgi:hypothetical protein
MAVDSYYDLTLTKASLRVIVVALEGFRDEIGGSSQDRVAVALREAREALQRLEGHDGS